MVPWPTVIFDGLTANASFFGNDVSFFSVADNINLSATNLNSDLLKQVKWLVKSMKIDFQPWSQQTCAKVYA